MIEEVDLSLRKIVADMTESAEKKLSDKIGATEIINLLEDAEAEHIKAMKKARTFFTKNLTAEQKENLDYKLEPSMTGESGLYRVIPTDDPAGATWRA